MTNTELKQARLNAGLTQTQAAAMVYTTLRQWQRFESGDFRGKEANNNYTARTELFIYKLGE